jgi:hypothetical protein
MVVKTVGRTSNEDSQPQSHLADSKAQHKEINGQGGFEKRIRIRRDIDTGKLGPEPLPLEAPTLPIVDPILPTYI